MALVGRNQFLIVQLRRLLPDWVVETQRFGAAEGVVATLRLKADGEAHSGTYRAKLSFCIKTMIAVVMTAQRPSPAVPESVLNFFTILSTWANPKAGSL